MFSTRVCDSVHKVGSLDQKSPDPPIPQSPDPLPSPAPVHETPD